MPRRAAPFRLLGASLAVNALFAGLSGPAKAQQAPARITAPAQAGWVDPTGADLRALSDPSAPSGDRQHVARRLVAACESPWAREAILGLLGEVPAENSAGAIVLWVLGSVPSAPPSLYAAVSHLASITPDDRLPAILPALSSFRTRESARLLLRFAERPSWDAASAAAFAGLARLSGNDLGHDRRAWESWLASCDRMTESQWHRSLADAFAARADSVGEQRRIAGLRLVESLRRLHLATNPGDRSALLTSLLLDELPEVRALGFELAGRELSASRRLDTSVDEAALALLVHPTPQVRENAALLVNQLGPQDGGAPVLAALAAETNPRAAAALISASLRWPSPTLSREVLRWLESGTAAAGAASDAALTLYRAGMLSEPAARSRVLGALRAQPLGQLSPSGCILLADIGEDQDREALAALLEGDSAPLRVATGEALAGHPEFLSAIVGAAAIEPQLFDTAVRAVVMAGPNAENFRAVAGLPTDSPETRVRSLLMVAGALPSPELLAAVREFPEDLPLFEAVLSSMANEDRILSERADPARVRAISDGLILLAEARLKLGRPDAAIAAIDALGDLGEAAEPAHAREVRASAMLALNRLDDALDLNVEPHVWLDALESLTQKPFARSIAALVNSRFSGQLSEQQAERLARLEKMIPAPSEQVSDVEFVGPPSGER